MKKLEGKVALVTGGSRGIGKGIAQSFVDEGARVVIVSRKAEACEEAAKELGAQADWIAGHVGKPEDAESCIDTTIQRHGSLDILVNNAATNPWNGPTIDCDLSRWDKTLEVNLRGPFVWSQLAWRKYMQEHGGCIINISSNGGFMTSGALGVYNITKAALVQLTKQLASELGPGVRVNAIAPGLVRTDFARVLWEGERGQEVADLTPLGRLGEPEDIGSAALFLAAPDASWLTGQTIIVDGGALIRHS
ncbi:MAG: SDR family oxidoreductase [Deltaproteobacteria bacterium]|nr:SDR family oxidoreductase [Deltaproteobacteria bacterium]